MRWRAGARIMSKTGPNSWAQENQEITMPLETRGGERNLPGNHQISAGIFAFLDLRRKIPNCGPTQ
jgi:hypothetical protein